MKPLFYFAKPSIIFASELKSLLSVIKVEKIEPLQGFKTRLVSWFNTVAQGVKHFPPGHYAEFNLKNMKFHNFEQY